MKPWAYVVLGGCVAAPALAAPAPPVALWVCSEAITSPEEVERMVATAAAFGVTDIFVQVRRAGDAYYASSSEPRSRKLEGQDPAFDPLAETVALASLFDLNVHAWLNVNYVWPGPDPPPSLAHVARRTKWIAVGRDGRRMTSYTKKELARDDAEGWYVNPAADGFPSYFAKVAAEVAARYAVRGVHLDFIRYPNYRFGYGEADRAAFQKERSGIDPIFLGYHKGDGGIFRPAAGAAGLADRFFDLQQLEWYDWRADQVTRVVAETGRAVRDVRPDCEFSAAVWANPEHAYRYVGQDWLGWYRAGTVDTIVPMTYWGEAGKVGAVAYRLKESRPQGRVLLGIGVFNHEEDYPRRVVAGLAKNPCDGVVLFDYGSCWEKPGVLPALASPPINSKID